MTAGVVLRLDTDKASEAQRKFVDSTQGAIEAMREEGKAAATTEKAFDTLAGKSKKAEKAQAEFSTTARKGKTESAALGSVLSEVSSAAQRMAAATGNSGAAQAVSVLATSLRGAAGAAGPLGIAVGLGAGVLIDWVGSAISAGAESERLSAKLTETERSFTVLGDAIERTKSGIRGVGASRIDLLDENDIDGQVRALQSSLSTIKKARRDLAEDFARVGDDPVGSYFTDNLQTVNELGKALSKSPTFFQLLNDAQNGSADAAFKLRHELAQVADGITDIEERRRREAGTGSFLPIVDSKTVDANLAQQQRQIESDLKVAETRKRTRDEIKAEEEGVARLLRERAASDKLAADSKDRATDAFRRQLDVVQQETKLLGASDVERRKATYGLQLETAARAVSLKFYEDQKDAIAGAIDDYGRQAEAVEALRKRLSEPVQIAVESEAAQRARVLGEEVFGTIGSNILRATQAGQGFRGFLQGVGQDLAQLAGQRFIVDQLVKLGGAVGTSLFGGTTTTPTPGAQNALGSVLPARGGSTFAANGLVLDRFQTFVRGGKTITTNEGGASTPEAIVPLQRDQYGRLGVSVAGGGASNVTINMPNVRSGAEARSIRPTIRQTLETVNRAQAGRRGAIRGG